MPAEKGTEPAVARSLPSLLAQTYEPLEIIIVGAHASATVVRGLAESDPRVRLLDPAITVREACLLATGDAVALIEPGAEVPESYYATLLPELMASPADFVSGLHPRPRSSAAMRAAHLGAFQRKDLSLSTLPEAFSDTALWTKLLTRSFLHSLLDGLPAAGPRVAATILLKASSFGYVPVGTPEPPRDEGDTQAPAILERLAASRCQLQPELAAAPDGAASHWFGGTFGARWAMLAREVPRRDSAYWKILGGEAARLVETPSALRCFNVHDRVLAVLAGADRLEDFRTVLAETQDGGRGYRVEARNGEVVARPEYLDLLNYEVPKDKLVLSHSDLPVRSRLRSFQWEKTGLRIGGFAYVPGIGGEHAPRVRVFLADPETGERIAVPTKPAVDARVNETTGDRWNDYSGSGFNALVSMKDLESVAGCASRTWFVEIEVAYYGMVSRARLTTRDGDYVPSRLPICAADDGRRFIAQFDRVQGLRLRVVSYRYLAARPTGDGLNFSLEFIGETPSRVVLEAPNRHTVELRVLPGQSSAFSVPLEEAAAGGVGVYQVKGASPGGAFVPVGAAMGSSTLQDVSPVIRPGVTGFGYLTLEVADHRIEVIGWSLSCDRISLHLTGPGTGTLTTESVLLDGPSGAWAPERLKIGDSGTTEVVFSLCHERWGTGQAFKPAGRYRLKVMDSYWTEQTVETGPALAGGPAEYSHPRLRIRTAALSPGDPFQLYIDSPLNEFEKGAHNQQRLIEDYLRSTDPLDEAVFFETFGGTSATDSGLAICAALGELKPELRRYWSVADPSVAVPAGTVPLHRYSEEWYRALGRSKYLVNNNTFPVFFRKKPGQVYLQTWHGTPLKRIGFDTPVQRLTPSYLRTLAREPGDWDVLLAQSPDAAELLAGAFRYLGNVPVLGYPRNDALAAYTAATQRKRVREYFRIPEEQIVVLYAPTWRDTARTRRDRHAVVNYLDARMAETALGPNYTILFRGHHNVAGQRSTDGLNGLMDVTEYPQVSDLCLAADLLVTDYSSIMFDFSVTGKPMFFLVPDLEEYRDSTRGLYMELQDHVPGPLAGSAVELFDEIRSYREEDWRTAYSAFVSKFAPFDDGNAARRVIDNVWESTPGESL